MSLNVSFKNLVGAPTPMQSEVGAQNSDTLSNSKNKKADKALLGLALTALAASGVYIATKGKKNPKNIIKMDTFKRLGKFDKGKAFLNDKPFTGVISTKNGCRLSYCDGVLQESITPNKIKSYTNGKLSHISEETSGYFRGRSQHSRHTKVSRKKDGTCIIEKYTEKSGKYPKIVNESVTTIKPDGNVTRVTFDKHYNSKIGLNRRYDKIEHLNSGKVEIVAKPWRGDLSGMTAPLKRQTVVDGKKLTEVLDKSGNVVKSWTTEFDPINKVSKQMVLNKEGEIEKIILRDKKGNKLSKIFENGKMNVDLLTSDRRLFTNKSEKELKALLEEIKTLGLPFSI